MVRVNEGFIQIQDKHFAFHNVCNKIIMTMKLKIRNTDDKLNVKYSLGWQKVNKNRERADEWAYLACVLIVVTGDIFHILQVDVEQTETINREVKTDCKQGT